MRKCLEVKRKYRACVVPSCMDEITVEAELRLAATTEAESNVKCADLESDQESKASSTISIVITETNNG